jgi:hypothetical protein
MPFADILCVFLGDFDSVEAVWDRLTSWVRLGPATTLPALTRPRLFLITDRAVDFSAAEVKGRLSDPLASVEFADIFSDVIIVQIDEHPARNRMARYRQAIIPKLVDHGLDSSRKQTRTLFSTVHMEALFRRAVEHVARVPRVPFDFIRASRLHHPVPNDLADGLEDFLKDIGSSIRLTHLAIPVLATSFLDNHCSPQMHGKSGTARSPESAAALARRTFG